MWVGFPYWTMCPHEFFRNANDFLLHGWYLLEDSFWLTHLTIRKANFLFSNVVLRFRDIVPKWQWQVPIRWPNITVEAFPAFLKKTRSLVSHLPMPFITGSYMAIVTMITQTCSSNSYIKILKITKEKSQK